MHLFISVNLHAEAPHPHGLYGPLLAGYIEKYIYI